tara:strand:+ start:679 stop:2580 length:1902 start_codon:yes stop_codon:yes gene_type:complete
MPLVNFSNVDFDQIKVSIIDYLRSNSNFTDYDFEGSNLSTIIDTLAYNTYITSYNANMATNEVFIDSATLRENVVSLARNIGYVPRSRKSAKATITFIVSADTSISSLTLRKGIVAVSSQTFGKETFSFSIPNDITTPVRSDGTAIFDNIDIYEGSYIKQSFTVSSRTPYQRYILPNSGIDTSLINVVVRNNANSTVTHQFKQFNSFVGVDNKSKIYFIQETDNERYELLFGDGVFGEKLQDDQVIEVDYIVSKGVDGNNINKFVYAGRLQANDGTSVTSGVSLLTTEQYSYGGKAIESIDSVKRYAPRIYASQNRAVTTADYEALIPTIYPEAESVSAYGGEQLTPPSFGRVFISIKPHNGVYIPDAVKNNIKNELKKYSVAGINPEIVDLKYLYLEPRITAYYNTNLAPNSDFVKTIVTDNVIKYSDSSELNKFGARFKYSKFLKIIDESNSSITSNITFINMRRDLKVELNKFADYELCYGNRFYVGSEDGYNIKSSGFKVSGISDTVYMADLPDSTLLKGTIFLFKLNSPTEPVVIKSSIGTIDYVKGEIKLNPLNIISTNVTSGDSSLIEVSMAPYSNDVIGLQDLYLQLDSNNTSITMVPDEIASGNDVSGSNYTVTSSYSTTSLTR